jgi:hypothetical protein
MGFVAVLAAVVQNPVISFQWLLMRGTRRLSFIQQQNNVKSIKTKDFSATPCE